MGDVLVVKSIVQQMETVFRWIKKYFSYDHNADACIQKAQSEQTDMRVAAIFKFNLKKWN